eukprot:TRINITY_DN9804_c0_g1_i1.p1 TRINITY_DN9804_c0_g1~~TRINITY_DN9804_c0_g1_i1.p1  ORF type:complete len:128 (+),score=18.52 TRINITY_DN9804_c0_g1_i1:156-539(+)
MTIQPILFTCTLLLAFVLSSHALECYVGTSTEANTETITTWPAGVSSMTCGNGLDVCVKNIAIEESKLVGVQGFCANASNLLFDSNACTDTSGPGYEAITCVCSEDLCNSATGSVVAFLCVLGALFL